MTDRVYLNDGRGRFSDSGLALTEDAIAWGDLDADGDLDALVANGSSSEGSYPTRLLWNDGGGRFTDSGQALNETSAANFDVGDLDLDGSLDVFVSNVDRPNEVWLNDGRGQLTDSGLRLEGSSRKLTTRPSLGDLDGDGNLDVMVAGFQGKVEVWINRTALPTVVDGGGEIIFISTQDGNDEIYVMNGDGNISSSWKEQV